MLVSVTSTNTSTTQTNYFTWYFIHVHLFLSHPLLSGRVSEALALLPWWGLQAARGQRTRVDSVAGVGMSPINLLSPGASAKAGEGDGKANIMRPEGDGLGERSAQRSQAVMEQATCAHIGDLIYVEDDSIGALAMSGGSVRVTSSAQFSSSANVFVLQQQGSWKMLSEYKAMLEREGLSWIEAACDPAHRTIKRQCEVEMEAYQTEFLGICGREVRYGMVVQLRHWATGSFLSATRNSLKHGGSGNELVLDAHAGVAACFAVRPMLRVHNEGERVRYGDPIFLESLTSGQRIICDGVELADGTFEAATAIENVTLRTTKFELKPFREWDDQKTDRSDKRILFGGTKVILQHKETETLLGCEGEEARKGAPLRLRRGTTESSAIWEVVNKDAHDGSSVQWNAHVMLRHVATGKALLMTSDGKDGNCLVLGSPADAQDGGNFALSPQYPTEGIVTTDYLAYLKYSDDFVSAVRDDNGATPPPGGQGGIEVDNESMDLVVHPAKSETDVFGVRIVDEQRIRDLSFILTNMSVFHAALDTFAKVQTPLPEASQI